MSNIEDVGFLTIELFNKSLPAKHRTKLGNRYDNALFITGLSGVGLFLLGLVLGCSVGHHLGYLCWGLTLPAGAMWLGSRLDTKLTENGAFVFLSKKLKKECKAFNKALAAREQLESIILEAKQPELYQQEMDQWKYRKKQLLNKAEAELVLLYNRVEYLIKQEGLEKHRKALNEIEKYLNVIEPTSPFQRDTRDYASLITAAMAKQQLEE